MKMTLASVSAFALAACLTVLPACKEKGSDHAHDAAGHEDHAGHDHDATGEHKDGDHAGHDHDAAGDHMGGEAGHDAGHGGAVIELGTATIGGFVAVATRDEGVIAAGKDSPIDVTVTPAAGSAAKAVAVRFWIGTEDAKGSVKAKGEVESPKEPNRWHTHAEIPGVIPEGCKLWVEIEDDQGVKSLGSFELKM